MTEYGARVQPSEITLVGRPWNEVTLELQTIVNSLFRAADVTNIVLNELTIKEGGGTTTVELDNGGGGDGESFLHMGA
jgi:hypothetical protein